MLNIGDNDQRNNIFFDHLQCASNKMSSENVRECINT